MEERRGFLNNLAVLGGIDRFFERSAQALTEELGGSGIHRILLGIRYADLNPEERAWIVKQWRVVMASQKIEDAGTGPPEAFP